MSRRLLIVAAHPDDEILGCGGLAARTLREGGEVAVLVLTEGCTAQYPGRDDLIQRKEEEARSALEILGGGEITFARLPDMALSTLPPAAVNAPVAAAVETHRPDWVLTHHVGDLNRDHEVAHLAARVACRPTPRAAPRLLAYETPSSTEWGTGPFVPDFFVELREGDLERKVEALRAYETEIRGAPHPRSPEHIRNLARLRGVQCGSQLAEAFRSIWERV